MTTTAESTMPNSVIRRFIPQRYQDRLIADLDAAQAAEVKEAALAAVIERLTPDDAHARASRTAYLETLIEGAIESKLAILQTQHQRFRTSTIQKYLKHCDHTVPIRTVIQRVLRKHGLYT